MLKFEAATTIIYRLLISILVWNILNSQIIEAAEPERFLTAPWNVVRLELSSDAKRIAAAAEDGSFAVWDIETFRQIGSGRCASQGPLLNFADQDRHLLTLTRRGMIQSVEYWNLGDGTKKMLFQAKENEVMFALPEMAPDEKTFVLRFTGGVDSILYNAGTGEQICSLCKDEIEKYSPHRVQYSSGGKYVSIFSLIYSNNQVSEKSIIFQADDGTVVMKIPGVFPVFSPDDKHVLTRGIRTDQPAAVYAIPDGKLVCELKNYGKSYDYDLVAFAPDGKTVYAYKADYSLKSWDVRTGKMIAEGKSSGRRDSGGFTGRLSVSPNGQMLTTNTLSGSQEVWGTSLRAEINLDKADGQSAVKQCFSSNGSKLLVNGHWEDTTHELLRIWDIKTGQLQYTISPAAIPGISGRIAMSRNGDVVAAASNRSIRFLFLNNVQ